MIRQLVFSMLAIAGMASCSSSNDHPYDPSNQRKINLGVGVDEIVSKAAINPQEKNDFTAADEIYLLRTDINKGEVLPPIDGVQEVGIDENKKFLLPSEWEYFDGEKETFFTGYYPAGTFSAGSGADPSTVSFANVNGEKDIVYASPYSVGTKEAPTVDPVLTFKHLLSQIQINVVGTVAGQRAFGKIKKISIIEIPTSIDLYLNVKVDLEVREAAGSPKTDVVIYEDAIGTVIPTNSTPIGVIPMIFSGGANPYGTKDHPLNLLVETEDGGETYVSVTNIGGTEDAATGLEIGKKHIITLTFKDKIIVSAAIKPWDPNGKSGSGDVG